MTETALAPALVRDMPPEEYHAHPALGSTSAKTLGDPELSMADVKYELENNEHKKVYDEGTLGHALILEGSLDHLVKIIDHKTYHSKAAQAERDQARNEGLIPVKVTEKESMIDPLYEMQKSVMAHPIAGPLLTGHEPEVSVFWERDGIECKGRLDAYRPEQGIIADLKLVRSARPNDVRKQISDLGYYIQAEHYLDGVQAATGFRPDWLFITVSKSAPYTVSVHRLEPSTATAARLRIDYGLERYRKALETGEWPGYNAVYEQSLTPWESIKNESLEESQL